MTSTLTYLPNMHQNEHWWMMEEQRMITSKNFEFMKQLWDQKYFSLLFTLIMKVSVLDIFIPESKIDDHVTRDTIDHMEIFMNVLVPLLMTGGKSLYPCIILWWGSYNDIAILPKIEMTQIKHFVNDSHLVIYSYTYLWARSAFTDVKVNGRSSRGRVLIYIKVNSMMVWFLHMKSRNVTGRLLCPLESHWSHKNIHVHLGASDTEWQIYVRHSANMADRSISIQYSPISFNS